MNPGPVLSIVIFILLMVGPTFAQQVSGAWLSEPDRARLEALRADGFEALFNLDYERARKDFKEVARLFPDHPALYETRRLQSSLYSSESFYSQNEDKAKPEVVAQFKAWTREARKLAEARLKQNPKDIDALYFLGATAGLKASFEEAVERRHFAALRDGSEAVDRHRDVIKLDPNLHDAEITMGLYDYVLGSLPLPIKVLAGITGARGSKKRGLATIERVAKEGNWARDDARTLLIVLYTRERRFRLSR